MRWQQHLAACVCASLCGLGLPSHAASEPAERQSQSALKTGDAKTSTPATPKRSARSKTPGKASTPGKTSTPGKASKRARAGKRTRTRKARQRARTRRRAQRTRRANRPPGWQWPPSPEMKAQGEQCKVALAELQVEFKRAPFSRGVATPIYVPSMRFAAIGLAPTFRKPPFVIDCHLALALTQVAPVLAEAGVKTLRFSSIYNYRRAIVGGKQKRSLSRHSYGLAVDVFEVEELDGTIHKVANDYHGGSFLKRVETLVNQSERFRLVLSPDNDPKSHSDHLHLEANVEYPATLAPQRP